MNCVESLEKDLESLLVHRGPSRTGLLRVKQDGRDDGVAREPVRDRERVGKWESGTEAKLPTSEDLRPDGPTSKAPVS